MTTLLLSTATRLYQVDVGAQTMTLMADMSDVSVGEITGQSIFDVTYDGEGAALALIGVSGGGRDVFVLDQKSSRNWDFAADFNARKDKVLVEGATEFEELTVDRVSPGNLRVGFEGSYIVLNDIRPRQFDEDNVLFG